MTDLHKLSNKSKLITLLSNSEMSGDDVPNAVVVTADMVPEAIKKDSAKFNQLYFASNRYGRFFIDRIDLEPALVWYTDKDERIERRFSDLFMNKLARCPRCGGALFRFGPYWMCKECEWDNVPNLGFVPLPSSGRRVVWRENKKSDLT